MQKKILVVDDDVNTLTVIENRLLSEGYTVIKAENGKDAVVSARVEHPDMIILDIMLPDIDGGKVAKELEKDETTKDIPIVFLTGLFTGDDLEKGNMRAGKRFITKPFTTEQLLEAIKGTLGG